MKLYRILLLSILTVSLSSLQATYADRSVPNLDLFLQPLQMTSAGLHCFFDQLYNSKRYTEDFYPNNFTHLEQFLEHGLQTRQERSYTKAILSLFGQKTKGCVYISAYTFEELLRELPLLVGYHFEKTTKTAEQKKKEIKQVLWQEFLNNFDVCKENPHLFFDNLSEEILKSVDPDADQDVSLESLRHSIIRFIEGGLNKVLWDPTDKALWVQVQHMADHLVELTRYNIITDTDDLNDLAWSLVHRLCYFIDVTGADLPTEFYEDINHDLANPTHALLLLEEQEELAEPKKAVLERVVMEGVAKQQAKQHGLITESLPVA